MGLLFDLIQQRQIARTQKDADSAKETAHQSTVSFRELDNEVNHLTLICRAMWELLQERNNLSEQDLLAKVQEIDLRDGKLDGKYRSTKECSSCHRALNRRHTRCIYCGAPHIAESAFDVL